MQNNQLHDKLIVNVLAIKKSQSDNSVSLAQNTIDMVRIVNKKQQSRVSKVVMMNDKNYATFKSSLQNDKGVRHLQNDKGVRHSDYPSTYKYQKQYQEVKDEEKYSTIANTFEKIKIGPQNGAEIQSFLSNYENNPIIGLLLYLIFIVIIAAEVSANSFCLSRSNSTNRSFKQESINILLISELFYYLIIRYIAKKSSKFNIFHGNFTASLQKLITYDHRTIIQRTQLSYLKSILYWILNKPSLLLILTTLSIIIGQISYSVAISDSLSIFTAETESTNNKILLSTIFWAQIVLPQLTNHFCINRPFQQKYWYLKTIPYFILLSIVILSFNSFLLCLISLCKIFFIYVHFKQGFDLFHIENIAKILLLLLFGSWLFLFELEFQTFTLTLANILEYLGKIVFITFAMLITRVLGNKYLKDELYRQFYLETHINLAFILASLILTAFSVNLSNLKSSPNLFDQVSIFVLSIIFGIFLHIDGKDKSSIIMRQSNQSVNE